MDVNGIHVVRISPVRDKRRRGGEGGRGGVEKRRKLFITVRKLYDDGVDDG